MFEDSWIHHGGMSPTAPW